MKNKTIVYLFIASIGLASCKSGKNNSDASGTFEVNEILVSSEVNGQIIALTKDEGEKVSANEVIAYIDSTQLYLKKLQLIAQKKSLMSRLPSISVQTAAIKAQLKSALKDQSRMHVLLQSGAVTQKQVDDADTYVEQLNKQLAANESNLNINSQSIMADEEPIEYQIQQINDQIKKCCIKSPIDGNILIKYMEKSELAVNGKAIYKLGDLSQLYLRAYISGDQLKDIRIGQSVKISADYGKNISKEYSGIVQWISDQSEFTPKTIQTNDERANLVYAIKIAVKNDGQLKSGMYGEVKFN